MYVVWFSLKPTQWYSQSWPVRTKNLEIQKADYKLRLREGERTISCVAPESGGPPLNLLDFLPTSLVHFGIGFLQPHNFARSRLSRVVRIRCSATRLNLRLDVDLLTIAGHKLYAPKGVGAAWMQNQSLEGWPMVNPGLWGSWRESNLRGLGSPSNLPVLPTN